MWNLQWICCDLCEQELDKNECLEVQHTFGVRVGVVERGSLICWESDKHSVKLSAHRNVFRWLTSIIPTLSSPIYQVSDTISWYKKKVNYLIQLCIVSISTIRIIWVCSPGLHLSHLCLSSPSIRGHLLCKFSFVLLKACVRSLTCKSPKPAIVVSRASWLFSDWHRNEDRKTRSLESLKRCFEEFHQLKTSLVEGWKNQCDHFRSHT